MTSNNDILKASVLSIVYGCCDTVMKTKIEKLASTDKTLKFFLDPLSYDESIDILWLSYISDDVFKILISREELRNRIKKLITDPNMDPLYNYLKIRYIKYV